MSSPASTAFRVELDAAIAVLDPAIRGLEDKVNDTLSEELRVALKTELTRLRERRNLEAANLTALDNLEANGYPELAPVELPQHLFIELQREASDSDAADNRFESAPLASNVSIGLGAPVDK